MTFDWMVFWRILTFHYVVWLTCSLLLYKLIMLGNSPHPHHYSFPVNTVGNPVLWSGPAESWHLAGRGPTESRHLTGRHSDVVSRSPDIRLDVVPWSADIWLDVVPWSPDIWLDITAFWCSPMESRHSAGHGPMESWHLTGRHSDVVVRSPNIWLERVLWSPNIWLCCQPFLIQLVPPFTATGHVHALSIRYEQTLCAVLQWEGRLYVHALYRCSLLALFSATCISNTY